MLVNPVFGTEVWNQCRVQNQNDIRYDYWLWLRVIIIIFSIILTMKIENYMYEKMNHSSSKFPKFRKVTYTMNPSYSRPVSLDQLFSQPVSLCVWHVSHLWIDWLRWEDLSAFSSIWKLFGTMSVPCVVPEMLWSLDDLKRALISEFPISETEEGEGFKISFDVWLVCWMGWNPVKLQQPASALLNLGNCGPESSS